MPPAHTLSATGITAGFTPAGGILYPLSITDEGAEISPLHAAPWTTEEVPETAPLHQIALRGDFLAAPMGAGDDGLHGIAANGIWAVTPTAPSTLRAVLTGQINGATVVKELSVTDNHPFLYQRHLFIGGHGQIPVCTHAMIAVPNGAKLSFSRKRWFETLAAPLEADPAKGRSRLAYPRRQEDPTDFPAADGSTLNLLKYPWADAHDDFVTAVDDPSVTLGWAAVVRPKEGDLILSLKNAQVLPMTMLWHSNGGRDYAPWNGRHQGCLGIEEGAALPVLGLSSAETPDPLTAAGQPGLLALDPEGTTEIRTILGAVHWPSGQSIAGVMLQGDTLTITGDWGAERQLPIRGDWLRLKPTSQVAPSKIDWQP